MLGILLLKKSNLNCPNGKNAAPYGNASNYPIMTEAWNELNVHVKPAVSAVGCPPRSFHSCIECEEVMKLKH